MRIVCLGDSITRGISYAQGRLRIVKENYPALLQAMLGKQTDLDILNKGVFNDNSGSLLNRLQKDVLAQKPDYVIIGIGGNDCNFRWDEVAARPDEAHDPIVPLDQFLDNVRSLVRQVQQIDAKPLLLSMVPLDPARYYKSLVAAYSNKIAHWIGLCGGIEHWHEGYNKALQQLVDSLNLTRIDVNAAFRKASDLKALISDDGIHPTTEGYRLMSATISNHLLAEL